MFPPDVVYSTSASKKPASANVSAGNNILNLPSDAAVIVATIVFSIVVDPIFLILTLTVPPVMSMGAKVEGSYCSNVFPDAAVLLSLSVIVSSGRVSPLTNFIVSE